MSTQKSFLKKVVLTNAQYEQRKSAGTLEEGVEYCISDALDAVEDVKVNNTSVVNSTTHVATIPVSQGTNSFGVMALANNSGLEIYNSAGYLYLGNPESASITARKAQMQGGFGPITTANFDFAVKAALTDGVGTAYTDAEKTAGRTRLGACAMAEYDSTAASYEENILYYVVED